MDMVFVKELKPILDAKVNVLKAVARPHSATQLLVSKTRLSVSFEWLTAEPLDAGHQARVRDDLPDAAPPGAGRRCAGRRHVAARRGPPGGLQGPPRARRGHGR